jgi:uncharacterized protein with HEPN domain
VQLNGFIYARVDLDEIWLSYERDIPPLSRTIKTMLSELGDDNK